ncbi:hypothetical protein [Pontibacter ruber]|uniref:Lipoprotein n=1 Tax=Pontibacter ruber TaxID=1343895 RepID=A0ABW5D2M5_9BACT|nr:hypothetical protein [Pontibacter ruber]
MKSQIILITLLGLLTCNSEAKKNLPIVEAKEKTIVEPSVNVDSLTYVVFTYDSSRYSIYWSFSKNLSLVGLSKEEITLAELLLLKQIDQYNQSQIKIFNEMKVKYPKYNFQKEIFIIENPSNYARQYIPAINSDGQKLIYINAFCTLQGHDYWKDGLVEVMDGGDCYFQLIINLTTKEVVEFSVNGVA